MNDVLGLIGAILLGGCCLPQTIKTLKTNRADDISWGFLAMWLIGEICMLFYVVNKEIVDKLLITNYVINLFLLVPILIVKWKTDEHI